MTTEGLIHRPARKTQRRTAAALLIAALLPAVAQAAGFSCTGTVDQLLYHQPGGVAVSIGGSPVVLICDPQTQFERTTPENCKFVSTLLTSAKIADRTVTASFDSDLVTSCSEFATWSRQNLRALKLN